MPEVMVLPELTATPIAGSDPALAEALAAAHLPTEDLADPGRYFFVFSDASGAICGFGGYELPGGHALIRSMVAPATKCRRRFWRRNRPVRSVRSPPW